MKSMKLPSNNQISLGAEVPGKSNGAMSAAVLVAPLSF